MQLNGLAKVNNDISIERVDNGFLVSLSGELESGSYKNVRLICLGWPNVEEILEAWRGAPLND